MKVRKYTIHVPWIDYKTILATASALGDDEKKAVNVPSDAYKIPDGMENVEMRLSANVAASGTFYVYAARRGKLPGTWDDIALLGSISVTTGNQVSSDDWYYVDTMVITDRWITEVNLADFSGNDGMSRFSFDAIGYDCVFGILTYTGSVSWKIEVSGFSG